MQPQENTGFFSQSSPTSGQHSVSLKILPVVAFIFLSTLSLFMWRTATQSEDRLLKENVNSAAQEAIARFQDRSIQISNALSRYGARIEILGTSNRKYLEADSQKYLDQIPALRRIGITDSKFKVIWSYPNQLRNQVENFSEIEDPIRKEAFEKARTTRSPGLSRTVTLRSGGQGYVLPYALFKDQKFVGTIYGSLAAEGLFTNLFKKTDFSYGLKEAEETIFDQASAGPTQDDFTQEFSFSWGLAKFHLHLTPTETYLANHRTNEPLITFGLCELFSFLFSLLIFFIARAQTLRTSFLEHEKLILARLNMALEAAQVGAWSWDLATNEIWRSREHDRVLGYTTPLATWNSNVWRKQIVAQDRPDFDHFIQQLQRGNSTERFDFRMTRADGKVGWIKLVAQTQLDKSGLPLRLVGILQDCDAEKSMESARQLDLEWRKTILNAAEYSIISTDAAGIIQTFNSAAENILGYTATEVIGKVTPSAFRESSELQRLARDIARRDGTSAPPDFTVLVDQVRMKKQPQRFETNYVRKDGSRVPVDLSLTPLLDRYGEIVGYLGIAIDLTAKRKAEEALRIAHERLQRVVDATGAGIWERSWSDKQIQFLDAAGRRVFGYSPTEIVSYADIVGRIELEYQTKITQILQEHIERRTEKFEVEFKLQAPSTAEGYKWILCIGRVNLKNGRPDQLVATISDVTDKVHDRHELERSLIAADSATKAKSAFLASMSHEIRTPLNGVIGVTDLLLTTPLQDEQKSYVKVIQQSGSALLSLINDVLDFSKMEAGKMELEQSAMNLAQTVESQIDILAVRAKDKNISLVSFISLALPIAVMGDAGRLGQVLLNLIGNAIKFTSSGGVSVRVFPIPETQRVRFEVSDSGIGIESAVITKLFQPFVQASAAISGRFGGTGLGLSISKRLVESMGGSIGVDSQIGKGSTFWFEIPLKETATTESVSLEKLHQARILVLESDEVARKSLQDYLTSFGIEYASAQDLDDANQRARQAISSGRPFDLFLLSSSASELGASVFSADLRKELGPKSPKLIYLCPYGLPEAETQQKGFETVLRKPLKQSQLFDAIASAMNPNPAIMSSFDYPSSGAEGATSGDRKFKILVAEDNTVNQLVARKMLEHLGYEVVIAKNGVEALKVLEGSNFDLILMDCQMPEMDGFETTQHVRQATQAWKTIPIVALTANAMDGDAARCLAAGMNDYLSKPVKKERLQSMLVKWLTVERGRKSA